MVAPKSLSKEEPCFEHFLRHARSSKTPCYIVAVRWRVRATADLIALAANSVTVPPAEVAAGDGLATLGGAANRAAAGATDEKVDVTVPISTPLGDSAAGCALPLAENGDDAAGAAVDWNVRRWNATVAGAASEDSVSTVFAAARET